MKRLRELDFLRGVAIILVLLRHIPLSTFTTNMGWVGVDLFFVLSGFLVSGLLFKEYIRFGNIKPKLFLIRRGFKIYPLYYLFYIPYLILKIQEEKFYLPGFLSDITFTQNFVISWGWAYPASWSLAVEEHFYFALAILLPFAFSKNIVLQKQDEKKLFSFPVIISFLLVACLLLRLVGTILFPLEKVRLFTNTPFRIDSLLAGVFISYWYWFKNESITLFFKKNKLWLYAIAIIFFAWVPFNDDAVGSFFVKTIGLTLLYISFGILLLGFLLHKNINTALNNLFSRHVVNGISKIGFCSYSIYIIHSLVVTLCKKWEIVPGYPFFFCAFTLSIATGMLMSFVIEKRILKIRDKYYPGRM